MASVAETVQDWKARLDAAWAEACWWDGMPATTMCAVFSEGNPGAEKHNQLTCEYFAWIRKAQDGR